MIVIIILSILTVSTINRALYKLERKQEALYYNMFLLRQKIRQEERAYLY